MNLKLEQITRNVMLVEEDVAKLKVRLEGLKRTASQISADGSSEYAKNTADGIVEQAKAILDSVKTLKASIIKTK